MAWALLSSRSPPVTSEAELGLEAINAGLGTESSGLREAATAAKLPALWDCDAPAPSETTLGPGAWCLLEPRPPQGRLSWRCEKSIWAGTKLQMAWRRGTQVRGLGDEWALQGQQVRVCLQL